jgi:hypothetical protein
MDIVISGNNFLYVRLDNLALGASPLGFRDFQRIARIEAALDEINQTFNQIDAMGEITNETLATRVHNLRVLRDEQQERFHSLLDLVND